METFFVSIRDDAINANIQMHMTVSANRSPDTRCAIGVSQGNNSVIQVVREDGQHSEQSIGNSLSRLEIVNLSWDSNHELRWIAELDDVEFDLTLKGRHFAPLWDTMFKGFYATGETRQVYCHTEQVITAEGTMKWRDDGKELSFSGFGWRDRGWGRRKTQLMWNTGWDLVAAILPDGSVFSFIALRSHELPEPAPLPIGGWYSGANTLTPPGGRLLPQGGHRGPEGLRAEVRERARDLRRVHPATGRVAIAMQESEIGPDAPNWAATMQDYYAMFRDPEGNEFPVFSQNGYIHRVDVFRDAQFIHAGSPPRKR